MTDPRRTDPPARDPALDAAWRAYSVETPPPALDAKILAAAHREAHSRPRRLGDDDDSLAEAREPSRWWWGLAAAATIGAIAFGIVQLAPPLVPGESMTASDLPQEPAQRSARRPEPVTPPPPAKTPPPVTAPVPARDAAPAPTPEMSTPDPLPPPPRAAAPAPRAGVEPSARAHRDAPTSASAEEKRESERTQVPPRGRRASETDAPQRHEPAPAPREVPPTDSAARQAFPASPSAKVDMKQLEPERQRAAVPPTVAPPAAPAPAAAGASALRLERSNEARSPAVSASAATSILPPEEYVARIAALHAAGKLDEAALLLNRFRVDHADADKRLPPELRAWAATVPRRP